MPTYFAVRTPVYKVTFKLFKNVFAEYYRVLHPCCETKFH